LKPSGQNFFENFSLNSSGYFWLVSSDKSGRYFLGLKVSTPPSFRNFPSLGYDRIKPCSNKFFRVKWTSKNIVCDIVTDFPWYSNKFNVLLLVERKLELSDEQEQENQVWQWECSDWSNQLQETLILIKEYWFIDLLDNTIAWLWNPMKINKKCKQIKLVFMTFEKNWSSFHKNLFYLGNHFRWRHCYVIMTSQYSKARHYWKPNIRFIGVFHSFNLSEMTFGTYSIIKYVLFGSNFFWISINTVLVVVLCAKTWILSRISMTKNSGGHWTKAHLKGAVSDFEKKLDHEVAENGSNLR